MANSIAFTIFYHRGHRGTQRLAKFYRLSLPPESAA